MNRTEKNLLFAAGAGLLAVGLYAALKVTKNTYNPAGKVALITGGSRGLGLLLAQELSSKGAKVAICARDKEELAIAKAHLKNYSEDILTLSCDLLVPSQIKNMYSVIKSTWGPVDILINNAGIIQAAPLETLTVEDFDLCMKTHFWAPLHCIREALPDMMAKNQGRIVNISSFGGKVSLPHLIPYSASKFALTGLSEGLYAELKKYSINVTTVCPSLLQTGSAVHAFVKGQVEKEFAVFSSLGVMPGVSLDAERAARKIVKSMMDGDAELLLGWPTQVASVLNGISPALTQNGMALVNSMLPSAEGGTAEMVKGKESYSKLIPSFFRKRLDRLAEKYNEN